MGNVIKSVDTNAGGDALASLDGRTFFSAAALNYKHMNTLSIRTIWAMPVAAIALIAFVPRTIAATETKSQPAQPPLATAPAAPPQTPAAATTAKAAAAPAAPIPKPAAIPIPAVTPTPQPLAPVTAAGDTKSEREFYSSAPIRLGFVFKPVEPVNRFVVIGKRYGSFHRSDEF